MPKREDDIKVWNDAKAKHADDRKAGKVKGYDRPKKKADRDKLRAERIARGEGR